MNSGRIYQLRRGLYSIAPPYQKEKPHPFLIANHLQRASYVSLQSALAFYGFIPETVNTTVSVTTGRPDRLETPLGIYEFRHIKTALLFGYQMTELSGKLHAILQRPYTKGRDIYDLSWYLSDPTWPQPNLVLLNNALAQTNWTGEILSEENWKEQVWLRLENLNWNNIVEDVRPFVEPGFNLSLLTRTNLHSLLQGKS